MSRRPRVARLRQARSVRPVGRRSARPSPVRAGAALVALAASAVLYGLVASPVFGFERLVLEGARFTSRAAVEAALGLRPGESVFGLAVDRLEARLASLPSVATARVRVLLPDTVRVDLDEREPILAWRTAEGVYLVDASGILFAAVGTVEPEVPFVSIDGRPLPVVSDRRPGATRLALGATLTAIDLDAARRLGSLRPVDVGSGAADLVVAVDEADGWSLRPAGQGGGGGAGSGTTGEGGGTAGEGDSAWVAVFGFYTPTLRPTSMIPGQVRLLRSLLRDREAVVARVVLASETDGTYVPRSSSGAEGGGNP